MYGYLLPGQEFYIIKWIPFNFICDKSINFFHSWFQLAAGGWRKEMTSFKKMSSLYAKIW